MPDHENTLGPAVDGIVIRSTLDSPIAVLAVAGGAMSAAIHQPGNTLRQTINTAVAGLPANPPPAPVSVTRWLRTVAADPRPTPTAHRAAVIIGTTTAGRWVGIVVLARTLGINPKNVSRAIGQLCRLGYLRRTKDGTKAMYWMTLP